MAIAINGTGTITGISVGGLNDSIITSSELANAAVTSAKLASGVGGKILQVVQTFKDDIDSTISTTYSDIPGMSRSITPVAAGSSLLVISDLAFSNTSASFTGLINLYRGSTAIAQPSTGANPSTIKQYTQGGVQAWNRSFTFLDTPTYTLGDSLTYKWGWQTDNTSLRVYINMHSANANFTMVSQITVMEVAA